MERLPYLGFIFHIGLYSYYGFDDIEAAKRKRNHTGSECYLERLSTTRETKIYHKNFGDNFDYFRAPLSITKESICRWMDVVVKCRGSYVIITVKHHDGFCLWPTATTSKKSTADILYMFREEAKRRSLQFGIYYSWYEYLSPFNIEYFNKVCYFQICELLTYFPDIIFFDGDDKITQNYVKDKIREIIVYIRSRGILVNNRICNENRDLANFATSPGTNIPNWQHMDTIGISWGYNKEQRPSEYKNGLQLFDMIKNNYLNGGTTCINIGPKFDGTLDENEEKSLNELSRIISI